MPSWTCSTLCLCALAASAGCGVCCQEWINCWLVVVGWGYTYNRLYRYRRLTVIDFMRCHAKCHDIVGRIGRRLIFTHHWAHRHTRRADRTVQVNGWRLLTPFRAPFTAYDGIRCSMQRRIQLEVGVQKTMCMEINIVNDRKRWCLGLRINSWLVHPEAVIDQEGDVLAIS